MKFLSFLLFFNLQLIFQAKCNTGKYEIWSPDKQIKVQFFITQQGLSYTVYKNDRQVLEISKLGLIREDGDFSKGLSIISVSPVSRVADTYELLTIKRKINYYSANKVVFHLKNEDGKGMDIIFQVSEQGVAFRYFFPGQSTDVKKIKEELTSFRFSINSQGWLQPMDDAKSGWAKSNPSYEQSYQQGIQVGTPSPIRAGWVYPALFKTGENWVLITETFPDGDYCATRLKAESPNGEYTVGFPQAAEVFTDGSLGPQSRLPWYTPWRIIAIGSLKNIIESTLGTDLATPAISMDKSIVKPGKSSWSWVLLKDKATVYEVQKQFIDYAAEMRWQYCLIDALWDTQIGYEKIKELADYAKTKKVGLLLWYNSAGSWNETPQTPRNKMLTHESRLKEFGILREMGIKGVKIDFFGGDGQSVIRYYLDILNDAKDAGLLVNFHGCTLLRGLQRTYPNLVTVEAIKGLEFATFEQQNLDEQPVHCTTIPYIRNVFDPMDYTPMVLYKIPGMNRKTTSAFELALPVIFQSGIQHLAETPEGMSHVPVYVKSFLQRLPDYWDDIKFIDGFPGKLAVLARRSGSTWYVAGINGENKDKILDLDLSFLQKYPRGKIITDGAEPLSFSASSILAGKHTPVKVKPYGGFVIVFQK